MPEFENAHVAKLVDGLDANVFTGDAFHNPQDRRAFAAYLARWLRALNDIETDQAENTE